MATRSVGDLNNEGVIKSAEVAAEFLREQSVKDGESLKETASRFGMTVEYTYGKPKTAVGKVIAIPPHIPQRRARWHIATELSKFILRNHKESFRSVDIESARNALRALLLVPDDSYTSLASAYEREPDKVSAILGVRPEDVAYRRALKQETVAP